jgi:protease IV
MSANDEHTPPPVPPAPGMPNATSVPTPEPLTVTAAAALAAAEQKASHAAGPKPALENTLERLAGELLAQRKSERRWHYFFRFAWLGLAAVLLWAVLANRNTAGGSTGPHTALVELRGEITAEGDASAEALVSALKAAFEDAGSVAVVLRINSPGGSPVQSGIVYDEIKRLKAKHNKKLYAAGADEIYVDKASIVGSIGVLMDGFGFTGLMDKLGVERRLLTAGKNKAMLDPFSPTNPQQTALARAMIDQIHGQFIRVVKEGRGERLKETPDTFSGLFWNGEEAVKQGLADHLGNLDFVAREVIKAEELIDYTRHDNVAERLAKRFGASIGQGAVKALRELAPLR